MKVSGEGVVIAEWVSCVGGSYMEPQLSDSLDQRDGLALCGFHALEV